MRPAQVRRSAHQERIKTQGRIGYLDPFFMAAGAAVVILAPRCIRTEIPP